MPSLSSRLDGLEAQLRALPTAPVEPPHVGLTMDSPTLLASIAGFGRVVAPLGITAADVTLEGVPSHVRPGQTLQLRLALGARHAEQSTEELEVSLGALAAASRCEVALCSGAAYMRADPCSADPQPHCTMRASLHRSPA